MSYETITPPEAVEAQQQSNSGNVSVSIEDWSSYKPTNSDQQTQTLIGQGTLPEISFAVDATEISDSMELFNASDLDEDGEFSAREAVAVYFSMDMDSSLSVSGSEFSEYFEERIYSGSALGESTAGGAKPGNEVGGETGGDSGEEDSNSDTVSSGANTYFDALDLDKDGQLAVSEAVMAFLSMDSDRNGSVNGKEFAKFLREVTESSPGGGVSPVGGGEEGGGEQGGGHEGGDGGNFVDGGCEGSNCEGGGGYEGGGGGEGGGYEGGGDLPLEREPVGGGGPMEGGMGAITIDGDAIPPELQKYARMEGDTLVIDAKGEQLPPLRINRNNVVIRNARINATGSGAEAILITGSNVKVLDSEIMGGTRGIAAVGASDITVDGNYLHDFENVSGPDGHAIEFQGTKGGTISNNRITGNYATDAVNILGSTNVKAMYNDINVTLSDQYAAPFMVEDGGKWLGAGSTHDIEVAYNNIVYSGVGVPPGLLGGYNLNGHDNVVNGDRSRGAWQLYHYEPGENVWRDVYYNGERIA